MSRPLLPLVLLLLYGIAFGIAALGGGPLAFDDHPGQLYRLHHAVTVGWAPWRLDTGWWAGYAELQYYPPGAAWLGAAVHGMTLGAADVPVAYQAVLWIAWLLPGLAAYALLTRVLGDGWLALPGAFLALTLSAGSRSGVEEGLRWGLVAARLGWGVLPLLALALVGWVERGRGAPLAAAPLLAAVVLLHPAHAPAALCLIALGACLGEGRRSRRLAEAGLVAALGIGLSALWLLPLFAHLAMALPLAWGDASPQALLRQIARPLPLGLALAQAAAWIVTRTRRTESPVARWLHAFTPAMAAVVALDALVAEPLGALWLPADRLMDSVLIALIWGASLVTPLLAHRLSRAVSPGPAGPVSAALLIAAALLSSRGASEPAISPWPLRAEWPTYDEVVRRTGMDALWSALAQAPPGRILFIRSSVSLDDGPEWWRPHSHIGALTPVRTGRQILNGTFTHPSPVAGLVYTGAAGPKAIRALVEERDGRTLFGRPLAALGVEEFSRWARRLRISAVVATEADRGRLAFLDANPEFSPPERIGRFSVYFARAARPLPEATGPQSWRLRNSPDSREGSQGWIAAGLACSPLWRVESAGKPLRTRCDDAGMVEVEPAAADGRDIRLDHAPGAAEAGGLALTIVSGLSLGAALLVRRLRISG